MIRRTVIAALLLAGCGDDVGEAPGTTSGGTDDSSSSSSSSIGATEVPTSTGEASTGGGSTSDDSTGDGSTSSGDDSSSGGDSSTGEPLDCGFSPPCDACACTADGWACDCPAQLPEAGYVELEPFDFVVGTPGKQQSRTSDPARMFYSYRPADDPNAGGPLFVHFNGGPGVSTGILMGFGTGPVRIDEGIVDNPASWTALGDLLYIDARDTGLSYLRSPNSADLAARDAAFDLQNFNIYTDAGDFARVLLRFLVAHPQLLKREIVIVGESYGGTRAAVLLNILLFREQYVTGGSARYQDDALVAEIEEFLGVRAPEVEDWTATEVARVFGRQVLIQPGIGDLQKTVAGDLLELPDSPVFALAAELGLNFATCAMKAPDCDPWTNAAAFVESTAHRSRYDLEADDAWLSNSFALTKARLSDLEALEAVLGVPPSSIALLQPAARADGFRMASQAAYPGDGGTIGMLGPLAAWDRYYLPFVAEINIAFRSPLANFTGVGAGDDHIVALMLHNMVYVDTFITASTRDIAIYAPSIPPTLELFDETVAAVMVGVEEFTVDYRADAYDGEPAPGSRTVRFPVYDASHSVAVDQPAQLRDDVAAWLIGE